MTHRSLAAIAIATCSVLALGLTACSSDDSAAPESSADTSVATTDSTPTETTDPGTFTTEVLQPGTTTTTAPPATPKPTTPAPTGPTVKTLTTPDTTPTCDEAAANNNQATVSWSVVNAASVILSIDGPGAYATGLPTTGSYDIPASCGDTQVVYITPVAGDGTQGTPKTITITISFDG